MKYFICSLFDKVAGCYARPFCGAQLGAIVRSFEDECQRQSEDNPLWKHPADYQLFHLATMDDASAELDVLARPQLLAVGAQLPLNLKVVS